MPILALDSRGDAPALPVALVDYEDLGAACRRLDHLSGHWDASAVVVGWIEPTDPTPRVLGSLAALRCHEVEVLVAAATSGLGDEPAERVWWRPLHPRDNLLRRARLVAPGPGRDPGGRNVPAPLSSVDFLTPQGGRGRLVVFAPEVDGEELRAEAVLTALRLPGTLRRQERHEAELRRALGATRQGILVRGGDDGIRHLNATAQRMLRIEDETCRMRLGDLCEGQLAELVDRAQRASGRATGEVDGPQGPIAVDVDRLDEDGEDCFVLALQDLTGRRRAERQQSEFVGTIGHELKTPLTSARTALELVRGEEAGALDADQRRMLDVVERNVGRLEHLVHQLLDTARQRVGRLVLERERRSLDDVLETALEGAHREAGRGGRAFSVGMDPRAAAYVDGIRFGEIVENLVGNALKFTPRGRHVGVRVRARMNCPFPEVVEIAVALGIDAAGCEIEVCDEGPGMDPLTRERAFDAFFQEGDPLSDRPHGAGLGLSIVRSLVDAHDGHLELDTEEGRGTSVRVWVPGTRALARLVDATGRLRAGALERARRQQEVVLELAPMTRTAETDLAGLEHVETSDALLVRVGDRHLARLTSADRGAAALPGARRSVLGKDTHRFGTTFAHLARELDERPSRRAPEPAPQEDRRA